MSRRSRYVLGVIAMLLLLAVTLALKFGLPTFSHDKEWTEDVLLRNGQQITVTRKVIGNETLGGIGDAGGWEFKASEIHFPKKMPDAPGPLLTHFEPMVLDKTAQGQWYVLGIIQMCEDWTQMGYPKLPYTQYNWVNGQWQQALLNQEFIGQKANLLVAILKSGEPAHHTQQSKELRLTQHTVLPEYREIVGRWETSCPRIARPNNSPEIITNENIKGNK